MELRLDWDRLPPRASVYQFADADDVPCYVLTLHPSRDDGGDCIEMWFDDAADIVALGEAIAAAGRRGEGSEG